MDHTRIARFLFVLAMSPVIVQAGDTPVNERTVRTSLEKALVRLEAGATNYLTNRDCFSCHHQALPIVALVRAKAQGFAVEEEILEEQVAFTLAWFDTKVDLMREGKGVPGGDISTGYALWALAEAGAEPNETIDAMIQFLLARQKPGGNWVASANRPPMEASEFTATAFALNALDRHVSPEQAAWVPLIRKQATAWLRRTDSNDTEDLAMRLWGLRRGGLDESKLADVRRALLDAQREDGGWGQGPEIAGDAYATGQSLFLLAESGTATDDPAYRRGIAFLLEQQRDDGFWIVETRSRPVQTFFDNGDPGGKSQFISMAATSWATLALLGALDSF